MGFFRRKEIKHGFGRLVQEVVRQHEGLFGEEGEAARAAAKRLQRKEGQGLNPTPRI